MKLPHRKPSRKKPLFITIAILAVALGGVVFWQLQPRDMTLTNVNMPTSTPTNTVDYGPPTTEQKSDQEQQKSDLLNNTTGDGSTTTTSPDTTLIVTISRAGQSAAGQPINVRTIVNGTSSGTCDMTFSRAGSSFTKTFPIAISASTITCNGDVEASAFSGGEWQISVVAKNGSASSQPTTTTFVVTP